LTDENDGFGLEAVQTMLLEMENNRGRIAVLLAGYPDRMKQFIESNPGLQSRFDRTIAFPDYSNGDLEEIYLYLAKAQDFVLEDAARSVLSQRIETFRRNRDFGNGREARRWLEAAIEEQARMWLASGAGTENDELRVLSVEAVTAGLDRFRSNSTPKSRVGYI
jgi:SpoVK/Ycf46/Vps4 family AAA+-type ATPase